MIIILHVLIALTSLGLITYTYFRPSTKNLRASYALTALTIASGFYLVWAEPAAMIKACTTGLVYLVVMTAAIAMTQAKLAAIQKLAAQENA